MANIEKATFGVVLSVLLLLLVASPAHANDIRQVAYAAMVQQIHVDIQRKVTYPPVEDYQKVVNEYRVASTNLTSHSLDR